MYDPTSEVPVVLVGDPALEWQSDEQREAYLKRREPDLWRAALRNGTQPTVFHCHPLKPRYGREADRRAGTDKLAFLFLAACHRVTLPDGRELRCETKKLVPIAPGIRVATDDWFDEIGDACSADAIYGIGTVIDERVHLKAEDRGPL